MLSDFKPTSAPGDDYKVIQFVETAQTRQGKYNHACRICIATGKMDVLQSLTSKIVLM